MTDSIPRLSEQAIRARFDPQNWQRGQQYARDDAIFNARRLGMTLKAHCSGSLPEPYHVQVTFDTRGIASAKCSCPVGDGGLCKHAAALLIVWLREPETFTVLEDTDTALDRRGKEELIALIKQMLRQQPELELLLEAPLPTGNKRRMPVNPEVYRKQAAAAFRRGGYEWGAEHGVARELGTITAIGDGFRAQGDRASAAVVYAAVSGEVLEHFNNYQDESGYLIHVVTTCIEGLDMCLTTDADAATRAMIIDALFAIYHFDVNLGGSGMSDEVPDILVAQTTPEEKIAIAAKVRETLPGSQRWSRKAFGEFLLELEADTLDDEAFLRICRESGRTDDLIDRLLTLGRVDEAAEATATASDYEMLGLADIFVEHEERERAAQLVAARATTTQDFRVLDWLKRHYKTIGDHATALELAERRFRMRAEFEEYREIREMAEWLGRWPRMRPSLHQYLTERQAVDLLMRIYLDEGENDRAVALARKAMERTSSMLAYGFYSSGQRAMALEVAKTVEQTHPRDALEIYRQQAERLIEGRNRGAYHDACQYLVKVRNLYDALDEHDAWKQYLTGLRSEHARLRALKEEMIATKLIA